jgi:hypothetical protein
MTTTELKTLCAKRESRVYRRAITVMSKSGAELVRPADRERRRMALKHGEPRRRGEKIVGIVCKFQHGVNNAPGRFQKAADELRNFRRIIADGAYVKGVNSEVYFQNRIEDVLNSQRRNTKQIIEKLRSIGAR